MTNIEQQLRNRGLNVTVKIDSDGIYHVERINDGRGRIISYDPEVLGDDDIADKIYKAMVK